MVLLPCSSCCCKIPAPPDEIEVEISSSSSHFGTVTLGRYASAGCEGPVAEASMSVLFTAPVGVFTLTPLPGGGYGYAEDYGSAGVVHQIFGTVDSSTSQLDLRFSLVRRVWVLGGTPATRESLEPLTWGEGRLGEFHTVEPPDSDAFSLNKANVAAFSYLIVRDSPASPSCRTILGVRDNSDITGYQVCGAAGCVPPFDVRIDVRFFAGIGTLQEVGLPLMIQNWVNWCPVIGANFQRAVLSSTGVMSPWPAAASTWSLEVAFRVARITLIYHGQPSAPQFEPRGSSRCTLPANYDVANCP